MKRPRLRKWAKWACTLVAGATVALAVLTTFWCVSFRSVSRDGDVYSVTEVRSCVLYDAWVSGLRLTAESGLRRWVVQRTGRLSWGLANPLQLTGLADKWHGGVLYDSGPGYRFFGLSLVYPILAASMLAALLWHTDRRRFGPHQCANCGYDRAGLSVARECPECGTVPTPASK